MNTPNKLTVFRIILVPLMVIISLINIPVEIGGISLTFIIMDIIFIIGSLTDKLDGYLARKNNQGTNFGKFLDPIADKILVISAMLFFESLDTMHFVLNLVTTSLMIICVIATIFSGYEYLKNGKDLLKDIK